MTKVFLLGANQEIDTAKKVLDLNQIVVNENGAQYVVINIYESTHGEGYQYNILHIRELWSMRTRIIRPLSQKFGIGIYYDDKNPQFLTDKEVADLKEKMQAKKQAEDEEAEKKRIAREAIEAVGKEWFKNNLPSDAKAMIVAYQETCDYSPYLDYQSYEKTNFQILAFSNTEKNNVSELRKYAGLFEGTAYLQSENPNDVHNHRGKHDFYIGYSNNWMIKKIVIQDKDNFINTWAYRAGDINNIHVKAEQPTATPQIESIDTSDLHFEIVDYSEKAIALFGDTKEIKDQLGDKGGLNGKFNPRLTHNGEKEAGWIFQKSKLSDLKQLLNIK